MKKHGVVMPVIAALLVVAGCKGPLEGDAEEDLRERLIASHRAYLGNAAAGPVIELTRPTSEVDSQLTQDRRDELDRISGPEARRGREVHPGPDLEGKTESPTVGITLQKAIQLTVESNLEIQQAKLTPAINQAQITQAEAVFDAVLFADMSMQKLDSPRPSSLLGAPFGGAQQTDTNDLTAGIRKNLTSGGQVTAQTSFTRTYTNPTFFTVNDFHNTDLSLSLTQPLLRGFGSDVNRAQIVLAENARSSGTQELRRTLLDAVLAAEQAYWQLYFSRQRLMIQQRLLERTVEDFNRIKEREGFDVNPVRTTEAGSFVELRRSEVIRARQDVRTASDQLKRLMNSAELPVSGEVMIVPIDEPAGSAVQFGMLDAVTTALRNRPEMQQSLLAIKDTSVRMRVADNLRLPELNISGTVRYNGLENDLDSSYNNLTDGDFIDYILGAKFEWPIGNRGPEGQYEQRTLERQQAVVAYQRAAQDVVLEVKNAMRLLLTSYELIGAAQAARRAAADNLRAIEKQEEAGVALTPEFLLDLKLSSQQRLADAETQEAQATTDYNTAIAEFYRTMGTLLERNGIEFEKK